MALLRAALAFLLAGAALASHSIAAQPLPTAKPSRYEAITCHPIARFKRGADEAVFGALRFAGGCVLNAPSPHFGGFSGVEISASGNHLLAVSDRGYLLSAAVRRDRHGRIRGFDRATLTPLRTSKGQALRRSNRQDLEGLTLKSGRGYVSSERNHAILPLIWQGTAGAGNSIPVTGAPLPLPPALKSLGYNQGIEALALAPASGPLGPVLLAIGETGSKSLKTLPGAYRKQGTWHPFQIARTDRFDATDAAFLPNGDLLVLERRFNLRDLIGMRLRRFKGASLAAGGPLPGEVLLQADAGYQIDNMEGLSVHQTATGETRLTLISDNNFSGLQRTLLLEFSLSP